MQQNFMAVTRRCDVCGKVRGVGSHARCSTIRQARGFATKQPQQRPTKLNALQVRGLMRMADNFN